VEPTILSRGLNLSRGSNSVNLASYYFILELNFSFKPHFSKKKFRIGFKNFSYINGEIRQNWYQEHFRNLVSRISSGKILNSHSRENPEILEKFWNPILENFLSQIPEKIPIPEKFFGIVYKKFLRIGYEKFPQNWFWNNHWKVCRLGQTPDTVLCSFQEFLIIFEIINNKVILFIYSMHHSKVNYKITSDHFFRVSQPRPQIYKYTLLFCLFVSNKCQNGRIDWVQIFLWDLAWHNVLKENMFTIKIEA